jgi:NAD(P)-dependent dehydrogenase (short-subunit alcohol dehydrogenase family)
MPTRWRVKVQRSSWLTSTPRRAEGVAKQIVADGVEGLPLSRMGTPEDLVGMCLFLLSDEAS